MKPVNLSVHRNTLEKKRRADIRRHFVNDAKKTSRDFPIAGYAYVMWDAKNNYSAGWHLGSKTIPGNVMPEFVKMSLIRDIVRADAQDEISRTFGFDPEDDAS